MIDAVRLAFEDLFARTLEYDAPLPMLPTGSHLPPEDAPEDPPFGHPVATALGQFFAIRYVDRIGQQSLRRITAIRAWRAGAGLAIDALCHERKARRTFVSNRIIDVIDIENGGLHDGERFLADHVVFSGSESMTANVIRLSRQPLIILSQLGYCDGSFKDREKSAISAYIRGKFGDDGYDQTEIQHYVNRLRPTRELVDEALDGLPKMSTQDISLLCKACSQIARSDSRMDDAEADFMKRIQIAAKRGGGRPF